MHCVLMTGLMYFGGAPLLAALLWLASSVSSPAVAKPAALTADQIMRNVIQRSESRNLLSNSSCSKYLYTKHTVTEELNSSGRLKDRRERLCDEVHVESGVSNLKLLQINGKTPPPAELKKTEAREAAERQRLMDAKPGAKGDERESVLTAELVNKYRFTLLDIKPLNGRDCYRLKFEPRGNLPVRKLTDRFLNQISGAVWVDAGEFEIARFEIHLNSEITLWGGLIATLKQCNFSLERTRLPDGVWLDSFSHGVFEGRNLLEPLLIRTRSESNNFHAETPAFPLRFQQRRFDRPGGLG